MIVDVLTVGDDLLDLSALEEVQLQQLRGVLAEVDGIQHTQQLPAHCDDVTQQQDVTTQSTQ